MNKAIFITGTICSGKTTLSERIGKALNIDVIGETNSNGFFGIIDRAKNGEFTSPVIVEHAEVYNLINKNRDIEISKYFDEMIVILLNVSDEILTKNFEHRKLQDAIVVGDYLKIDMFEMKREIESYFNEHISDFAKYVANINSIDDYELEYEKIVDFLADNLH